MNLKQTLDWLGAVSGCFPKLRTDSARAAVSELGALAPLGSWEAGISGAGFARVHLRFSGAPDYRAWSAAASPLLGVPAPAGSELPPANSPWLETRWDLAADARESCVLYGRTRKGGGGAEDVSARTSRASVRFDPRAFPDAAVARALSDFAALSPVAAKVVERERAGRKAERRWALRLAGGLPWPAFLRCDISASFTPLSAQIALLTPAHAVRELSFEGESLWAYFGG